MMDNKKRAELYKTIRSPINRFWGYPKLADVKAALVELEEDPSPYDANIVLPLIWSGYQELALQAARIISLRMKHWEKRHWVDAYEGCKGIDIEKSRLLQVPDIPQADWCRILGLATLNHNGYVREAAVWQLEGMSDPQRIPYLLMRLNDWVAPVRQVAWQVLDTTFDMENLDGFIENYRLVEKLRYAGRTQNEDWYGKVIGELRQETQFSNVKAYLSKKTEVKKRFFVLRLLEGKCEDDPELIRLVSRAKSVELKMWLLRQLPAMNQEERRRLIALLLTNRSGMIVATVIGDYEDEVMDIAPESLLEFVCDARTVVRETARFIVKKRGMVTDFAQYYRDKAAQQITPGVILGLGEKGTKDDYAVVSAYAKSTEPQIRAAVLTARWRLDEKAALGDVIDALEDAFPKLRSTARRLLKQSKDLHIVEDLKRRYDRFDEQNKRFVLRYINHYGGWQAYAYLLRCLTREQGAMFRLVKELVLKWKARAVRLQTCIDRELKESIQTDLQIIREKELLGEETSNGIAFIIRTQQSKGG